MFDGGDHAGVVRVRDATCGDTRISISINKA